MTQYFNTFYKIITTKEAIFISLYKSSLSFPKNITHQFLVIKQKEGKNPCFILLILTLIYLTLSQVNVRYKISLYKFNLRKVFINLRLFKDIFYNKVK